jgi:hypothetical protein
MLSAIYVSRKYMSIKKKKIKSYDLPYKISGVNPVLYNKHRNRKNHEIVGAMYAMYCLPKSLEEVGKAYRKSRQAIYDLFKSRGYKLRSKQMNGLQILVGMKFTITKGGYLRGTLNKKRILMHYYVWEKKRGPVPKDHCIYHKDKNKENNALSNLAILHKSKMSKKFNPNGNNQYTKKAL